MDTSATKSVFLTGVTGFLGSHLAQQMLGQGHHVYCLSRPREGQSAKERALKAIKVLGDCDVSRLHVLSGDLTDLDVEAMAGDLQVSGGIKEVWHCAGSTCLSKEGADDLEQTNVQACNRILALTEQLTGARLMYVGTAYQCGDTPGIVPEAQLGGAPPQFRNAYESSKWRAEQILWRWGKAQELLTVFRPSIVIGRSDSQVITTWQTYYIYLRRLSRLITLQDRRQSSKGFSETMILPGHMDARLDLVFVDDVVESMLNIAKDRRSRGSAFHLTSNDPWTLAELHALVDEVTGGCDFEFRDDDDTLQRIANDPVLCSLAVYMYSSPEFGREESRSILRDQGYTAPRMTREVMLRHTALAMGRELDTNRVQARRTVA